MERNLNMEELETVVGGICVMAGKPTNAPRLDTKRYCKNCKKETKHEERFLEGRGGFAPVCVECETPILE